MRRLGGLSDMAWARRSTLIVQRTNSARPMTLFLAHGPALHDFASVCHMLAQRPASFPAWRAARLDPSHRAQGNQ